MSEPAHKDAPGTPPEREGLKKARRVVVKVGSSSLTGGTTALDRRYLTHLVASIGKLWGQGRQVALVTSGAVAAGRGVLGFKDKPATLPERQACAAAGQVELMKLYADAFRHLEPPRAVGQILLTRDLLEHRQRYLNARNTLEALFAREAVPIINENDTIAVDELRFGDNDRLSALVTVAVEAQVLIILTDVEGLLDAPPGGKPEGKLIPYVPEITPAIEALAKPSGSELGTGGMVTKLEAAKIVTGAGEAAVLVSGRDPGVLLDVVEGRAVGTYFAPAGDRLAARKRWLAYAQRVQGALRVDAGAKEALVKRHKSLLPSGIIGVQGLFESGDLVVLVGPEGDVFARGLTNYSMPEVEKIRGKRSSQIAKELGQLLFEEVVHCDNLVLV